MFRYTRFAGIALLFLLSVPGLLAQRTAASLSGTVLDESNAVIPGASVTATETSTQISTTTQADNRGFYTFPSLSPGDYSLRVEKAGFKGSVQQGIILQVDRATTVNTVLKVGATAETVTITEQSTQVDVRTATLSYEVTDQAIKDLPLNGRDMLQLMTLTPDVGVTGTASIDQTANRPEAVSTLVSASGGQGNTTAFYLDGGPNEDLFTNVANVYPNPDSVQEFNFESNNYSSKFTGAGGGVMNVVTRGGTNQFHGSLFEFIRNGPLFDARSFFATANDGLKWNQFGGAVGGPIKRDKTFFFFSYQGLRESVSPAANSANTETAAELAGNWSSTAKQLVNPGTGAPFVGNQVPTGDYDPIALKLIALVPVASPTTGVAYYTTHTNETDNQYVARVDHHLNEKLSVFSSYLYDALVEPSVENLSDLLSEENGYYWRSQHASEGAAWEVKPHLLSSFEFTFNRVANYQTGAPGFPGWTQLGAQIPNLVTGGVKTSLYLAIGSYFSPHWVGLYRVPRQDEDYSTTWSYVAGNHTIEFGGEIQRDASTLDQDYLSDGDYTFSGSLSGNNLLDFMLGYPSNFEQIEPLYNSQRKTVPALYVNDVWKVTHGLTLTLGVRWDPWIPWTEVIANQISLFNPAAAAAGIHSTRYPNLPPGMLVGGDPGVPNTGFPAKYDVIDPRIGFAYDVFGNGTTSIRGGFGIFHDQVWSIIDNRQVSQSPFSVQVTVPYPSSTANPYKGITDPYPVPQPTPSSFTFPTPFLDVSFAPGAKDPTNYQWNLTVERQLPAKTLLRIGDEGSRTYHLFGGIEDNAGVYNPALTYTQNEQTIQARRPYGKYFTNLALMETIGVSNYNAFVAAVEKRPTHGLSLMGGYRWSKCLDEVSVTGFSGDDYSSQNPAHDYGPCAYNVKSQLIASYIYRLPDVRALSYVGKYLLSGWQTTGIITIRTGVPFSVLSGQDLSASGIGLDRADIIGNPSLPGGRSLSQKLAEWFNTAAFVPNAPGTFGDSGRDSISGPGYRDVDASLAKAFPIGKLGDSSHLDFRADFFDALNIPNFSNPTATLNSTSDGRITSSAAGRTIQFSLKYNF